MKSVYLVTAEQGQSIHMKKWNEKIFDSEDKANAYVIEKTEAEKAKVNNKNEPVFYHLETMELE